MARDSIGRRLLSALAGSTPAFTSAAVTEGQGVGRRLLSALAGSAPTFRSTYGSDEYTPQREVATEVNEETLPEVGSSIGASAAATRPAARSTSSPRIPMAAREVGSWRGAMARGSWFRRFWARSRAAAGAESVGVRLAELEQAIYLQYLGKAQADVDATKAEAVASLLRAMEEQEDAVIRLGSLIVIKAQGALVVWNIGEMEAAALERNSDLLSDPVAALKLLHAVKEAQESTSVGRPKDEPSD